LADSLHNEHFHNPDSILWGPEEIIQMAAVGSGGWEINELTFTLLLNQLAEIRGSGFNKTVIYSCYTPYTD
jgi:hypothetical protein